MESNEKWYRSSSQRWRITNRHQVFKYVQSLGEETAEWLLALYLDGDRNLLSVDTISQGGLSACDANFRKVISRGLAIGAAGFVLVHNHPSGDLRASETDIRTTVRLAHISAGVELRLFDHFIVTRSGLGDVGYF